MTRGEWLALFGFVLIVSLVAELAIVNAWWPVVGTIVVTLVAAAVAVWRQQRSTQQSTTPN